MTLTPEQAREALVVSGEERFEPPARLVSRFWARVEQTETCWLWTGDVSQAGYGDLSHGRRHLLAHRLSFQIASGYVIPGGVVVRHRCDIPLCVRPQHLELGSPAQNVRDTYERNRRSSGTWPRGTARPNAVLNDELVAQLRRAARGGRTISSLAREHGLAHATAYNAIRGKGWSHVTEPPVPRRRTYPPHRNNFVRNNPDVVAKARSLRDQGRSLQEIADQLGITKTTAFRCCRTDSQETES